VARDRVGLAAELGHPPGVDHVLGEDLHRDRRVHRHVEGVVAEQLLLLPLVVVAPEVLLRVHADPERVALRRLLLVDRRVVDALAHLEGAGLRARRVLDAGQEDERDRREDHEDQRRGEGP
jgi:hypothetical protein